ncbi:MAG: hypothetical protein WCK67_01800 [bacterium]
MHSDYINVTTKAEELSLAIEKLENLLNTGDSQKIIEEIRMFKANQLNPAY